MYEYGRWCFMLSLRSTAAILAYTPRSHMVHSILDSIQLVWAGVSHFRS